MTPLEIALEYIGRGWAVVPIPHKRKKPLGEEWQGWRITKADAHRRFNGGPQNVGVILGEASGGLADVDLDSIEAVHVGPYFLPRTLCFGRPSKPRSHWLYQSDLCRAEDKAAIQFKFATGSGKDRKEQMILELRIGGGGKGAQTVFPGSVHETGELIAWDEKEDIARAEGDNLKHRCARAASAALLAEHFPSKGARHDAGLTLGGFSPDAGLAARTRNSSPRPSRSQAASLLRKSKTSEKRPGRHGTKPAAQAAGRAGSRLSRRPSGMTSQIMFRNGLHTKERMQRRLYHPTLLEVTKNKS
jgi:Bifunctional DNA primase/polymerase, N-terminal